MGGQGWERPTGGAARWPLPVSIASVVVVAALVVANRASPPEPVLPIIPEPTRLVPTEPVDDAAEAIGVARLSDRWRAIPPAPLVLDAPVPAVWDGRGLLVWPGFGAGVRFEAASESWSPMAAAPIARSEGWSATWSGRQVLYWGGRFRTGAADAAHGAAYDPAADRWSLIPPAPLSGRTRHAAVWAEAGLFVWGGAAADGRLLADGAIYDGNGSWRLLSDAPLSPRRDAYAAWTGSTCPPVTPACVGGVLVWGGVDAHGSWLGDGALYVSEEDAWRPIPPLPVAFARTPAAAWTAGPCRPTTDGCDRRLLVWGRPADGLHEPWAWAYDLLEDEWQELPSLLGQVRADAQAVWTGELAIVWGGVDWRLREQRSDGFALDPRSRRWQQLPRMPAGPRSDAVVVWAAGACADAPCDGALYVWGGTRDGQPLADGVRYAWPPEPLVRADRLAGPGR